MKRFESAEAKRKVSDSVLVTNGCLPTLWNEEISALDDPRQCALESKRQREIRKSESAE